MERIMNLIKVAAVIAFMSALVIVAIVYGAITGQWAAAVWLVGIELALVIGVGVEIWRGDNA